MIKGAGHWICQIEEIDVMARRKASNAHFRSLFVLVFGWNFVNEPSASQPNEPCGPYGLVLDVPISKQFFLFLIFACKGEEPNR